MLRIADNLNLPLDAVTQKAAWLGRTGSGKTYGAGKLAEEMLGAGAQVVILDPVGVWYGLRIAADGKGPGISIPVFGGLHGDVPLEPASGKYIADLIIDQNLSVVLDVSQFEYDTEKAKFATEWCDRFFFRKKAAPSAVHVFLEECQEFIPQNPAKGEEKMLHAFNRMWKIGRNFGIGGSLISQRPQEINKKAINLTECMFAFQMTGPHERKTVQEWIADKGIAGREDFVSLLPKLEVGQAHIWSPSWLKISATYKIGKKRTFNASSTPEVGKAAVTRTLAPIDLERIRKDMAATIERAKADDPKELRKKIADLERQLKQQKPVEVPKIEVKTVEVPVLTEQQRESFKAIAEIIAGMGTQFRTLCESILESLDKTSAAIRAQNALGRNGSKPKTEFLPAMRTVPLPDGVRPIAANVRLKPSQTGGPIRMQDTGILPAGELAVLTAIAQYEDGIDRDSLSVLTGYKRSTRDAYIQRLRDKGYVEQIGNLMAATVAGLDALGPDFEPLPTGMALQDYWRNKLPEGERKVLEVLIHHYPRPVQRDTIDEVTGYKRSSRDAYIQRLSARRLVENVGRGEIKAVSQLF